MTDLVPGLPETPQFTSEEAEAIFSELGTLSVELDNDPLSFGPKRLNKKTAEVRRMLDRCERLYLEVSRQAFRAQRALRIVQTELDMAKKNLFANDPETRAGRSVSDREAIAAGKLSVDLRKMHDLEVMAADLEAVLVVVKAKRGDLKDVEGRLKDQIRLCQSELGVGGQWGSQLPPGEVTASLSAGKPAKVSDALLVDSLIAAVEDEVHLAPDSGLWQDPVTTYEAPEVLESAEVPEVLFSLPEVAIPVMRGHTSGTEISVVVPVVEEVLAGPSVESELLAATAPEKKPEEACPGTVDVDAVSIFLSTVGYEEPKKQTQSKIPSGVLAVQEENLLDFLLDFEQA